MVKGLYTAYTGMVEEQRRLDVLTNNLANADTVGYKKEGTVNRAFYNKLAIKIKDTGAYMNAQNSLLMYSSGALPALSFAATANNTKSGLFTGRLHAENLPCSTISAICSRHSLFSPNSPRKKRHCRHLLQSRRTLTEMTAFLPTLQNCNLYCEKYKRIQ